MYVTDDKIALMALFKRWAYKTISKARIAIITKENNMVKSIERYSKNAAVLKLFLYYCERHINTA